MSREAQGQPRAGLPAHEKPGVAATAWINLRSRHGASRSHQRPAGYTNDCVTRRMDRVRSIDRGKGARALTRMGKTWAERQPITIGSPWSRQPGRSEAGNGKARRPWALLSQVTAFSKRAPEGTRTPNLLIRRSPPFPLAHAATAPALRSPTTTNDRHHENGCGNPRSPRKTYSLAATRSATFPLLHQPRNATNPHDDHARAAP